MHRLLAAAILALSFSLPAQAAQPGTSTQGDAWGDFVIGCTTCPHFLLTLSGQPQQLDQGPGATAVNYSGGPLADPLLSDYTLAGGAAYAGFARFDGPLSTPWLGARASTDNEPVVIIAEPNVPVGIDLYTASVDARTVMQYQYTGTAAASYTFHFAVDGFVTNDQSSVFASAALYATDATSFETGLIDFGYASFAGSGVSSPPTAFAGTFSVTVNVAPGDSFWMLAGLSVLASHTYSSADVSVNAYDTLKVTSIDGDTQWLQAAAVPEPAPLAMLLLGLIAVQRRLGRRLPR